MRAIELSAKDHGELLQAKRTHDRKMRQVQAQASAIALVLRELCDDLVQKYNPPFEDVEIDVGKGILREKVPPSPPVPLQPTPKTKPKR